MLVLYCILLCLFEYVSKVRKGSRNEEVQTIFGRTRGEVTYRLYDNGYPKQMAHLLASALISRAWLKILPRLGPYHAPQPKNQELRCSILPCGIDCMIEMYRHLIA